MKTFKNKKDHKPDKKIVVFYFPWKIVSGGPIYLATLANNLAKIQNFEVFYIEYIDGYSRQFLDEQNVTILEYNEEHVFKLFPDEKILLITPIYWGNRVPFLNPESVIIFFNWHNLCIPSLRVNLQCNDEGLLSFLSMVSNNNAEFYCDKAHWDAQEEYGITFKENYVPITIPERGRQCRQEIVNKSCISIAVIGRLVIDKVYSITDLIDNLSAYTNKKIEVFIIGDGECHDIVENYEHTVNITLHMMGTLALSEISDFLREKVDLLFAMGTSALEGAALSLPTVIIPNDIKPFKCDKYVYIFDCVSFLLGWGPNQIDKLKLPTYTAKTVLEEIYDSNKKSEIGKRCRNYYVNNHKDNTAMFVKAISDATLTYKTYCETLKIIRRNSKKWAEKNIVDFNNKQACGRKVLIWGAGKGGEKLLKIFRRLGINVDSFIDNKADEIVQLDNIPVHNPDKVDKEKYVVYVSLLTYVEDITKELEERGLKKGIDYCYVFFPNY